MNELYRRSVPPPGPYIEDARALVATATAELVAWLERRR